MYNTIHKLEMFVDNFFHLSDDCFFTRKFIFQNPTPDQTLSIDLARIPFHLSSSNHSFSEGSVEPWKIEVIQYRITVPYNAFFWYTRASYTDIRKVYKYAFGSAAIPMWYSSVYNASVVCICKRLGVALYYCVWLLLHPADNRGVNRTCPNI